MFLHISEDRNIFIISLFIVWCTVLTFFVKIIAFRKNVGLIGSRII